MVQTEIRSRWSASSGMSMSPLARPSIGFCPAPAHQGSGRHRRSSSSLIPSNSAGHLRTPSGQLRYPGVTDFLLEVGRYREGTSGNFTSPDLLSVTTGGTGFYKWHTPGMAAGVYWARLRLKNDCGIGRYSPPASFTWH